MADKAWKRCERRVAKYIGGERVPVTGRQRGSAPDIEHLWLSPEVKYKQKMPDWIRDAMSQAKASARPSQMPCVILCQAGEDVGKSWIVFELHDFTDRFIN